jgi:hypothetical protein
MRPGSNAIEAGNVSEKCNGLLIREDHPGLMQLGLAALNRSENDALKCAGALFSKPISVPRQFIMCLRIPSRSANAKPLHAIVDLSRRLGYLC